MCVCKPVLFYCKREVILLPDQHKDVILNRLSMRPMH